MVQSLLNVCIDDMDGALLLSLCIIWCCALSLLIDFTHAIARQIDLLSLRRGVHLVDIWELVEVRL